MGDDSPIVVTTDTGRFSMVPEWVVFAPVSANAVRLYAILAHYADWDSGATQVSRKRLAEHLQVKSRDTVDRTVKELVELGALEVQEQRDAAGDRAANVYVVRRVPAPVVGGGRTDAATGGRTGPAVDQTLEGSEKDSPASPSRRRDVIWDTLVEIYHDPAPSERSDFGKTVREIKANLRASEIPEPDWPEEVRRRALAVPEEYRSHRSLRVRWSELGARSEPEPPDTGAYGWCHMCLADSVERKGEIWADGRSWCWTHAEQADLT